MDVGDGDVIEVFYRYFKDFVSYSVRVVDVEVMFPSNNKRCVTLCSPFGSGCFVVQGCD
jgi:hypothetical protein